MNSAGPSGQRMADNAERSYGKAIDRSPSAAPTRPAKFVDAAALRALEGTSSPGFAASWNWLKKAKIPSPKLRYDPNKLTSAGLSTLQFDAYSSSFNGSSWISGFHDPLSTPGQTRPPSSVYSQATMPGSAWRDSAPPVPPLPAAYKTAPRLKMPKLGVSGRRELDVEKNNNTQNPSADADAWTFQKRSPNGSPGGCPSCDSPRSHGWWDYVVAPFLDKKLSFSSRLRRANSPSKEPKSPRRSRVFQTASSFTAGQPYGTQPGGPAPVSLDLDESPGISSETPCFRLQSTPVGSMQTPNHCEASFPGNSRQVPIELPRPAALRLDDDQPPPYSPPERRTVARERRQTGPNTRRWAPPRLSAAMTSQGASRTMNPDANGFVDWPCMAESHNAVPQVDCHSSSENVQEIEGRAQNAERQRRRHEREDVTARRVGSLWRGRGCVPEKGCVGRLGREGRKRRRWWGVLLAGIMAFLVFIIVLAVILSRRHRNGEVHSIWVNLTDFPPMPTGVLTVVGPENIAAKSVCTEPSTLWSCWLPKDQHDSVVPYQANQPTIVLQIQWDNRTQKSWQNPAGASLKSSRALRDDGHLPILSRGIRGAERERRSLEDEFHPQPKPADVREMRFLGNTTDGIKAELKEGEATPFYISLLTSEKDTISGPKLSRRQEKGKTGKESKKIDGKLLPPPKLDADGTAAAAALLPNPIQQPARLLDRGLPTEHYGFYSYFGRTLFLRSVPSGNKSIEKDPGLDKDGGCKKSEAKHLVTWGETRMLVQIWTRALESKGSALLRPDREPDGRLVRPGTMPYPVTVTLDTHGGDGKQKAVWDWRMNEKQGVDTDTAEMLANDMDRGGTWINPRIKGDASLGGFDGGTGGCQCAWRNWLEPAGGLGRGG